MLLLELKYPSLYGICFLHLSFVVSIIDLYFMPHSTCMLFHQLFIPPSMKSCTLHFLFEDIDRILLIITYETQILQRSYLDIIDCYIGREKNIYFLEKAFSMLESNLMKSILLIWYVFCMLLFAEFSIGYIKKFGH